MSTIKDAAILGFPPSTRAGTICWRGLMQARVLYARATSITTSIMASRRTQVRSVIDSIPSTELLDVSKESLQSLTESNLAAVDVWASNGNIRQVRQAGTGLVALCAWFAMKA